MVVSWLGINRFYFIISMEQPACHKSQKKDDTNLQAFTDGRQVIDYEFDKNSYINCKANFPIFHKR
jgi:hypothetical protein